MKLHLPNGSSRVVRYAGKAQLSSDLVLEEVLYVPEFTHNLISIAQLTEDAGVQCHFYNTHCVFQRGNKGEVLGIGRMKENLYIFETITEMQYCNLFNIADMSLSDLHNFLGHSSISTMQHMKALSGMYSRDEMLELRHCEICLRSKQNRNPFPQLQRRRESLFELVHVDLWGPYGEDNVNHYKYVLTIVEDHSRTIWTYLLRTKDQVPIVIHAFIKMVEVHFEKHIRFFRTDNGTEFVNERVAKTFRDHGVLHQRSCAHSPQHNGIVERRHRTLLESARALMYCYQMCINIKSGEKHHISLNERGPIYTKYY